MVGASWSAHGDARNEHRLMYSPATPRLTPDDYRQILDVLTANANSENAHIRREIAGYLEARDTWTQDARNRRLPNPY